LANIEELLNAARDFDEQHPEENRLEAFLEQTALVNDTDDWEEASDRVSLMTLHAAKGLEFSVVFITAVEQGLLPHERSKETEDQLEEERRLLFVGITRAKEDLQLSLATNRFVRGGFWPTVPSCFLMELPREEMQIHKPGNDRRRVEVDDDWHVDVEDDAYDDDTAEVSHRLPKQAAAAVRETTLPRVMTAAEMIGGEPAALPKTSPDEFCQGMLVSHQQYGTGRIVALSGSGKQRKATIQFFGSQRQIKIVLSHSNLKPVRSPSS
jgi:DNA helicase-2/ATP-dependent DNA helicase PcrA